MLQIIACYWYLKRTKHMAFDLLTSLILVSSLLYFSHPESFLMNIKSLTKACLPVLTFQATLNASSLIYFANSNSVLIKLLKSRRIMKSARKTRYRQMDQIYAYFAWTVLIQFIFLLYALFLLFIQEWTPILAVISIWLICLSIILAFGMFYSSILCIRNIGILFTFLIWKDESESV